jgi:hypothetical protein
MSVNAIASMLVAASAAVIFLLGLGLLLLLGYAFLGQRYWFSVPFRGVLLATTLYAAALVIAAA